MGEPAASLPKLDFERLGVANSGKEVRVIDFDPGMKAYFDYLVAGSGAV